jgi:hypothetical protein
MEGPANQMVRVDSVVTEEIDAVRLVRGKEYQKNLLLPTKQVTLLRDEPVVIKLVPRRKNHVN